MKGKELKTVHFVNKPDLIFRTPRSLLVWKVRDFFSPRNNLNQQHVTLMTCFVTNMEFFDDFAIFGGDLLS